MLKGYRIAGKTETKQKGLKSFIYFVLKMQTGGCLVSMVVSKVTVNPD
jgi:hypothetical protein